jgi:hypothetical protein
MQQSSWTSVFHFSHRITVHRTYHHTEWVWKPLPGVGFIIWLQAPRKQASKQASY